jgi:hypothetical protein
MMKTAVLSLLMWVVCIPISNAYKTPLTVQMSSLDQPVVYLRIYERGFLVGAGGFTLGDAPSRVAGGGGGALFSLIELIGNEKPLALATHAADTLFPYYDMAALHAELAEDLREKMRGLPMVKDGVRVEQVPYNKLAEDQKNEAPAVLAATLQIYVDSDLRSLHLVLCPVLYQKSPGKSRTKEIYWNFVEYHSNPLPWLSETAAAEYAAKHAVIDRKYPEPLNTEVRKKYNKELAEMAAPYALQSREWQLQQWTANDGALLRGELKQSLAGLADLLVLDIQDASPPTFDKSRVTISETNGREIFRLDNGHIISAPTGYVAPPAVSTVNASNWKLRKEK